MDIVNIYENYNNYFNQDLKSIFEACSKAAQKYGFKIYLIGGIVRDMMLGIKNLDVDVTVEGDAIEFCRFLEKENIAKIISEHKPFGTVKVEIRGKKIDFASTRSEIYPKKGHLPVVEKIGCSLREDVIRRDFTINSLALSLNEENFAQIIDYVGGVEDLKSKKLRILHDKSFIDDPTRIIRGLKFSVRLGFEIEENTLRLQKSYLKNINYDMGYKRVKSELKQTFGLNSQLAFDKFIVQGIYKLITEKPILKSEQNIEELAKKYKIKHPWIVYFGIAALAQEYEFLDKMQLTKDEKEIVIGARVLLESKIPEDDFGLYKIFSNYKIESLLIFAILSERAESVFHYLDDLKKIKLSITGKDLLELGFEPSKTYGEIFDYVLSKKIQNPSLTKGDEIAYAKGLL